MVLVRDKREIFFSTIEDLILLFQRLPPPLSRFGTSNSHYLLRFRVSILSLRPQTLTHVICCPLDGDRRHFRKGLCQNLHYTDREVEDFLNPVTRTEDLLPSYISPLLF